MRFSQSLILVLSALALIGIRETLVEANDQYQVGVAAVNITPEYPVRLHGFGGRRTESDGITQRIWAKALAIGADEDRPVILFTVDNLGTRLPMLDEVAKRLKEKVGIERQRIALTFTHSHTTPKTVGSADTIFSSPIPPEHQVRIDRYTAELTDAIEKVALDALADRKPATLEWAVGQVGFAINRRTAGGPVDHSLPMLVVKSPAGEIRAFYVTYACHCVTLSDNKISGDWAGYAQQAIEIKHPGTIALVSIGCGSDANPNSGVTGDNIGAAAEQGGEIADEVDRLLRGNLTPVTGKITATLNNIELPLNELPTREALESLAAQEDSAGYNAKYQLAKLDRGEKLLSAIDYPIQTIVFGDSLAMVFLAGEVCVDYSLRLKQELDADRVWLHGYANDFCAYIPSERLVGEGGYGGGAETVYFALPSTLKAGLEDKIVAEVRRQIPGFLNPDAPQQTSRFHPTSPKEALNAIQVSEGLVVELMAAEPLVVDPVAIDFGFDGSLWVVEMRNYAHEVNDEFEQAGCITHLMDRDGDGKFDKSTIFQSGLRFPTDVKVWGKGIIVCDAPDVIYLEDTDGDGTADLRKVLLSGFETHNAQARVNSLQWGLDNWLYGSCGLFGGTIRSFDGQTFELGNRDFRFRPQTGEIEAVTGRTQQSRVRDDWNNWFGCDSGTLCKHYPLDDYYLGRNSFVLSPPPELSILDGPQPTPYQLFPIGKQVLFKLSGPPGVPTSACGLGIYRDELLGQEFYGNSFTAEPVNQLIHRRVVSQNGTTFRGVRANEESDQEFLASTDHWFRPVQVRTGTDGCLWIVDMCRYVIEHPRFIPEETLRTLDVHAGDKAGRIFRVRPSKTAPRSPKRLRELETASLVAELNSPNGPYRDLVHQLLIERGDQSVVPALAKLSANADRPAVRLQALCALDGLSAINEPTLVAGLNDSAPEVRRHAIRLSEQFLDKAPFALEQVLKLVEDEHPQVQLQLAYSLGESQQPQAAQALAKLAWKHRNDPYLQAAILSSVRTETVAEFLHQVKPHLTSEQLPIPLRTTLVTSATKLGAVPAICDLLVARTGSSDGSLTALQLSESTEVLNACDAQLREQLAKDPSASQALVNIVRTARGILNESESSDEVRLVALRAISATGADVEGVAADVAELLNIQSAPTVQQAAVEYLVQSNAPASGDLLLEKWNAFTPATRSQVVDAVLSKTQLLPKLIAGIQAGTVSRSHLDALQRQRLLQHADESIRNAAKTAFAGSIDADRQKVIEAYAPAGTHSGNASNGRELFRKHCSNCHKLEDHGFAVGPDLASLTNRSSAAMLEAIFDPNRNVDERYQSYSAISDDGRVFTGLLASEGPNSVTLLEQAGKQHTLLRSSLEEFQNTRVSLMPEGFEKDLTTSDVADLLSYISTQGRPPKQFPGNEPKLIKPSADGSIALLATNCEIYGDDIAFEATYRNIGYWHGIDDHIAWTLELPTAGTYTVYLDAACADDVAGNVVAVDGLGANLQYKIPATGGWNKYQAFQIGTINVAAGRHRIVVRPAGDLRGALLDLRALRLISANAKSESETFDPTAANDAALEISKLTDGLKVGTPQEYKRIPGIFENALAAGKRNVAEEIQRVLYLSVPQLDEPAQHWQVVAVGGGIVNGLSQIDVWPRARIRELLANDERMQKRWDRMIELSATMADDEAVPGGTRYDALRMLGVDTFESRGSQLVRYLQPGVPGELHMGAVSALVDIDCELATQALLDHLLNLNHGNRELAIVGLTRTDSRLQALLTELREETIRREDLPPKAIQVLKQVPNRELREAIEAALAR